MRGLCFSVVVVFFLAGCGSGIIPIQTAQVNGTATFEGEPLENYRVFFFCDDAKAQEPATGLVQADGSFVLSVRKPGDGAIVGTNKVWLTYDPPLPEEVPGMESGTPPPPAKVKLPEKFMSSAQSEIVVEVPKGGLKDYRLTLP
jgi:hypothetical protein